MTSRGLGLVLLFLQTWVFSPLKCDCGFSFFLKNKKTKTQKQKAQNKTLQGFNVNTLRTHCMLISYIFLNIDVNNISKFNSNSPRYFTLFASKLM